MRLSQLLSEQPHTRMTGGPQLPLIKHGNLVDWGFEDLGVSKIDQQTLERALRFGTGVKLPDTGFILRSDYPDTFLVTDDGTNDCPSLPEHWMRAVFVVDDQGYTWIGDMVNHARVPRHVTNSMRRTTGGWER